jgi:hypothetical protein
MFRFVPGVDLARITELEGALAGLPDAIPELERLDVGRDEGLAEGNHDMVVIASFADPAGYLAYATHPAHVDVVTRLIRPIISDRSAIQFRAPAGEPGGVAAADVALGGSEPPVVE